MSPLVQFINGKCLALYSRSGLPLRLSPLTEDTSMIAVSSCGVRLQEVLSGLEKNLGHTCALLWLFSTFIQSILNFFVLSTLGVISATVVENGLEGHLVSA